MVYSTLIVTSSLLFAVSSGLKCYGCDEEKNQTCPGWSRGVVDTVADLGDQLGLYTHCVTVELGDGRIVNQGPYPGDTHCAPTFLDAWAQHLNAKWNQEVEIRCCTEDHCNGDLVKNSGVGGGSRLLSATLALACLLRLLR